MDPTTTEDDKEINVSNTKDYRGNINLGTIPRTITIKKGSIEEHTLAKSRKG